VIRGGKRSYLTLLEHAAGDGWLAISMKTIDFEKYTRGLIALAAGQKPGRAFHAAKRRLKRKPDQLARDIEAVERLSEIEHFENQATEMVAVCELNLLKAKLLHERFVRQRNEVFETIGN
jgi:hypothetical protein